MMFSCEIDGQKINIQSKGVDAIRKVCIKYNVCFITVTRYESITLEELEKKLIEAKQHELVRHYNKYMGLRKMLGADVPGDKEGIDGVVCERSKT